MSTSKRVRSVVPKWIVTATAVLTVIAFSPPAAYADVPIYVDADYTGPETGSKPQAFDLGQIAAGQEDDSQTVAVASLSLCTACTDEQGDQGLVSLGYHYLALPDTLTLAANPSAITANGISTTTLTAALTEAGNPVPDGTEVVFTTTHGHLTNWDTIYTTTTTSGVATATLTSVPSSSDVAVTVQATSGSVSDDEAVTFQATTCQSNFTDWAEHGSNPIFDPAQKVYYPTVIYDASAFGHSQGDVISASLPYTYVVTPYYKMWTAKGEASPSDQGIQFVYSDDGLTWHQFNGGAQLPGLVPDGYHSRVLYDAGGFGSSSYYYKIWYWDPSVSIYGIAAMRTANSEDGLAWVNDQEVTQSITMPLVTGAGSGWNRGTYGPVDVLYNPSAANSGANPFNYSFVMYYDATDGGSEVTGLAYSDNGIYWTRYGDGPVLDKGPSGAWDRDDAAYGTVIKDNDGLYHFWYSGGGEASNDRVHAGIGYAVSADGIHWSKSLDNPIFHINDGAGWRSERTYTPIVLYDPDRFSSHGHGALYKMWFTGDGGSNRAIGYALLHPPSSVEYTAGNGQVSGLGVTLDSFVVTVKDSCDDPIGGVPITYTITGFPGGAAGQNLSITNTNTLSNGQASSILTLGDAPGVYTVTAEASGLTGSLSGSPVVFTATAQESGGPGAAAIYLPITVNDYAF